VGRFPGIETIENLSSVILIILTGLLPAKRVAVLVDECDQLCSILEKSVVTAKSAGKPGRAEASDRPLPMTNHKFSMTNSQSRSPKP
jgi:hypothetical protein